MVKKYNYKDDFEMVYLRQEYLAKIDYLDPKWVEKNKPIVNITATKMYHKLKPNFDMVGFDVDDLISITNVYMLAYMGLYSLETNEKLRERFVTRFTARTNKEPEEKDFIRTERNNLINFLRQRIQHCANLCERKSRNIKVGREKRGYYAETVDSKPADEEVILQDYKRLGYRKVTHAEFKEAKIKARLDGSPEMFDKDGFRIIEIQLLSNGINKDDYQLLLEDNYQNIYNHSPEHMMIDYEDSVEMESYRNKFKEFSNEQKIEALHVFIDENRGSRYHKPELKMARKMIKDLKSVV